MNAIESVFLRLMRRLDPRQQRAIYDGMLRRLDGQPLDEALVEVCIELGDTPAVAQRRVQQALADKSDDWRRCLD